MSAISPGSQSRIRGNRIARSRPRRGRGDAATPPGSNNTAPSINRGWRGATTRLMAATPPGSPQRFIRRRNDGQKPPPLRTIGRTARFRLEARGLLAAKAESTVAFLVDHEAEIAAARGPLVVADSRRSVRWTAAFIDGIVAIMVKDAEAGLRRRLGSDRPSS